MLLVMVVPNRPAPISEALMVEQVHLVIALPAVVAVAGEVLRRSEVTHRPVQLKGDQAVVHLQTVRQVRALEQREVETQTMVETLVEAAAEQVQTA